MGEAVKIIDTPESIIKNIDSYSVIVKYGDKKLVDCMKNTVKLTLTK